MSNPTPLGGTAFPRTPRGPHPSLASFVHPAWSAAHRAAGVHRNRISASIAPHAPRSCFDISPARRPAFGTTLHTVSSAAEIYRAQTARTVSRKTASEKAPPTRPTALPLGGQPQPPLQARLRGR